MGQETTLFTSKDVKPRADLAAFLRGLADRVETGQIVLKQGAQDITLDLPAQVTMELKVEDEIKRSKGTQHKLEVELSWYDGDTAAAPGGVEFG